MLQNEDDPLHIIQIAEKDKIQRPFSLLLSKVITNNVDVSLFTDSVLSFLCNSRFIFDLLFRATLFKNIVWLLYVEG